MLSHVLISSSDCLCLILIGEMQVAESSEGHSQIPFEFLNAEEFQLFYSEKLYFGFSQNDSLTIQEA